MRVRRSAILLGFVALTPLLAMPARAAVPHPQIRLIAATSKVDAFVFGHGSAYVDPGIYLGVDAAALRIDVSRTDYDSPITARLEFDDGQTVAIPPRLLKGWDGLRRMIDVTVFHAGAQVLHRMMPLCPNGYDEQRLDGDGPFDPTFPESCGGNPFTLGSVWGIDQGWSANAFGYGASMRLDPGHYRMDVAIAAPYRALLGVADADASVSVRLHVVKGNGCVGVCPIAGETPTAAAERRLRAALDPTPDPATLPDLAALPAWGIDVDRIGARDVLSFGATVWNAGPAPLIVEGYRTAGSDTMAAYEYFSSGGTVVGRAPVGTFEFDRRPGHEHWHFEQFARYRLLDDGGQQIVRSKKEGFCLAPTDAVDLLVPGAVWRPGFLGFSQCGGPSALWIRETLPAGWGDTYEQSRPGQAFDITSLPNGTYQIEVTANPTGELFEVDPSNDTQLRTVILHGTPGHRWVTVPPVGDVDA